MGNYLEMTCRPRLPRLVKFTEFRELAPEEECGICYTPFRCTDKLDEFGKRTTFTSYCGHTFCLDGIRKYLKVSKPSSACPMCMSSFSPRLYAWPKTTKRSTELLALGKAIKKLVLAEEVNLDSPRYTGCFVTSHQIQG